MENQLSVAQSKKLERQSATPQGPAKSNSPTEISYLDRVLAVPMFLVGLSYLLLLGAFLHLTADDFLGRLAISLLCGMLVCHVLVAVEWLLHRRADDQHLSQHKWFVLLPLLRICPRDHITGNRAWVPFVGWRYISQNLEQYLTRLFGVPMIIIALLVLPVVAVEFCFPKQLESWKGFKLAIDISSGLIWVAFVFELVVMIAVVEKKFAYCRKNWIDVAIVFLPLISFIGAARLGRLMRLKQLTRTAKIYRMRGLALRSWRGIVALEVLDKLIRRDPIKHQSKLEEQIAEKERELAELRSQLERLRNKVDHATPLAKADAISEIDKKLSE